MDDQPPPPPPPHGEKPKTTHGEYRKASDLPPGNYDIFIIPPHSSGAGFLYLPSLQCHRNSFIAGCLTTFVVCFVWSCVSPVLKAGPSEAVGGGNGLTMTALVLVVGIAGWALGTSRADTGSSRGGHGHSGPGGSKPESGSGFRGSSSHNRFSNANGNYSKGPDYGGDNRGFGGQSGGGGFRSGGPGQNQYSGNQYGAGYGNHSPGADSGYNADWEKDQEEAKRREEHRQKMEEQKRKREEEAQEQERRRERENMERELRERREQLEREIAAAARAAREKAEQEAAEAKARAEETRRRAEREAAETKAQIEIQAAEAKAKAEREVAEARAKSQREAVEAKLREMRAAAAARAQAEKQAAEANEKANRDAAEAKAKAEKEAAEKEAAARATAKKEADAKFAALKEAAAKKYAEKKARDSKEAAGKGGDFAKSTTTTTTPRPTSNSGAPRTPPPKKPQPQSTTSQSTRTTTATATEDDAYSFRPYERPRRPYASTYASSAHSESSYAPSQTTTTRTSPPPFGRGAYSTKDPDKIVIKGVFAFNNTYIQNPFAQLVSGEGMVTDGLVLRITTEGLFIDDDLRGVPEREWDVKAWTMKTVDVWCPQVGPTATRQSPTKSYFRRGPTHGIPTAEESEACLANLLKICKNRCCVEYPSTHLNRTGNYDGDNSSTIQNLHVLRASIRDQEGKKYVFVLQETEGWKVPIGIQRLRGGTQIRALGISNISANECRTLLGRLTWC